MFGLSCNFVEDYSFFTFKEIDHPTTITLPDLSTVHFEFCGPFSDTTQTCNTQTLAYVEGVAVTDGC